MKMVKTQLTSSILCNKHKCSEDDNGGGCDGGILYNIDHSHTNTKKGMYSDEISGKFLHTLTYSNSTKKYIKLFKSNKKRPQDKFYLRHYVINFKFIAKGVRNYKTTQFYSLKAKYQ